ncbi:MAG: adaptor protein MecA [Clostridia bacterium]|nr:adaptor protein MecA [Clostridia bacterium]
MRMELLRDGALKIWMNADDLDRFGITFDTLYADTASTRRTFIKLLAVAKSRLGFCPESEMKVEVMALPTGCLFVITPEKEKIRICTPQIYAVVDAEELLRLGEKLALENAEALPLASLYQWESEYRLVVYNGHRKQNRVRQILSEFTQYIAEGNGAAAFLEEHGVPIIQGTALHRLCATYESR